MHSKNKRYFNNLIHHKSDFIAESETKSESFCMMPLLFLKFNVSVFAQILKKWKQKLIKIFSDARARAIVKSILLNVLQKCKIKKNSRKKKLTGQKI